MNQQPPLIAESAQQENDHHGWGLWHSLTVLCYAMPVSPKRVDQARVALVKDWATRGVCVVYICSIHGIHI